MPRKSTIAEKLVNCTVEKWRTLARYPRYQVSNWGRVRRRLSQRRFYYLKPQFNGRRLLVGVYSPRKYLSMVGIHLLVAECFLPTKANKPFVLHKDGCLTNNRADNLVRSKRRKMQVFRLLSEAEVAAIRQAVANGATYKEVAAQYGASPTNISRLINQGS